MKKLVVFASGNGSNAENIVQYFKTCDVSIEAIFCNVEGAGVIERANWLGIPSIIFNRSEWNSGERIDLLLQNLNPDLIVLAGFLWMFPTRLLLQFPHVLNIHPSLLPKFGGKGMFGMHVHHAVIEAKEVESGITIHWVNEFYDKGEPVFQAKFNIHEKETAIDVAAKIHALEFEHFPRVIEQVLKDIAGKS